MATNPSWVSDEAPALTFGAWARWDLKTWLGTELKKRVPGCAHQRLSEDLLGALTNEHATHSDRIQRAILKQETWRLLMTLRATARDDSAAIAEFEALVTLLAKRMEEIGVPLDTSRKACERLGESLEDLRDWPLV